MSTANKRHSIKNKIICGQCNLQILESDDSIQCDCCEKIFHPKCTKLNKKEFQKLLKNDSLVYNCHLCDKTESTIGNDLSEINAKLNQLDEINKTMKFMSSQYDDILKGVLNNKKKIENLQKENKVLKEEINNLKSSVKFLNDSRVKNDCVISGVELSDASVAAVDVVLEIAEKIGSKISENQIDEAFFVGKARSDKAKKDGKKEKKSIVVKFTNQTGKRNFMSEKLKLKEKDDLKGVYINDYMSRETMELFNYAKSTKAVGYSFVFHQGNRIFVKKNDKSRKILIKNMNDVDNLLLKSTCGVRDHKNQHMAIDDESSEDDVDEDGSSFMSPN